VRDQLRYPATTLASLTESIVTPALPDRGPPPASVVTWVASHFAAVGVFFSSVVLGSATELWRPLVIGLWLAGLSGLCARLLGRLLAIGGRGAGPRRLLGWGTGSQARVFGDFKLGFFLVTTYFAYLTASGIGPFAVGGFLAVLAFTIGLRFAGLDAMAGRVREPWFYVHSVVSIRGLLAFGVIAVVSAGVFLMAAVFVDPWFTPAERTVEEIFGLELSRSDQFQALVIGAVLLSPPALMVCEAIGAVSRHEAAEVERAASYERRLERDGIARDLHDGMILSTLGEIRALATDEAQKELVDGLDAKLRDLHLQRLQAREARTIRMILRRPLEQANRRGLGLNLETDGETLSLVVDDDLALLLERLMMIQIDNSIEAGAEAADVEVGFTRQTITLSYRDDGPGFDPGLVDRKAGGLARIRFDIEHAGGSMTFHHGPGRTTTEAVVPRP
jgi:signal transduction histidine kinase